ncbi:hypothetical protein L226DRAFT_530047 [Lentinus tigrinus ALCF2SS1-7]|uniref:uncharacterized protein n=1 Tax=Lentinus tigrinus ALCF2SS1-7 TaxID=1328758 RepID=UPI00116601C8|nr:hypothetical protein L226DRAFT_530047 [Lentinus tigrinus ALCF2SS1-7]
MQSYHPRGPRRPNKSIWTCLLRRRQRLTLATTIVGVVGGYLGHKALDTENVLKSRLTSVDIQSQYQEPLTLQN